ncbi:DNA polymerase-3 subunit alpha [Alkalithermobacter thermoalcaliphilus JW-YL-7 = DSM 7308]|uniref:DNA polymerase III PolC-type n=1 Tax=Alkalithermobacter thermoalcaliphilus JW-YL-7 = DSM 7308 TaxID=1121328 RepID=A0A150FQB9_CLOPD|nr:DNA polymerase III polC-type [[Clostridium] paradoxum JW-YL-7 = DSM 7308]SHK59712.1 DNA polymerase-3 subunit alpha [[Clostridium] paradoxum JW-YL-7 = DSM 7308]
MKSLAEYLQKLGIKNTNIDSNNIFIERIVYFKENKDINIYLNSKHILSYKTITQLEKEITESLRYFNKIKIKMRYVIEENESNHESLKKYWDNILYIITTLVPSSCFACEDITWNIYNDILYIHIEDKMLYERLIHKNAMYCIKNAINEELGIDISVKFILDKKEEINIDEYIKKQQEEIEIMLDKLSIKNEDVNNEEIDKKVQNEDKNKDDSDTVIYGKEIKDDIEKINNLHPDIGKVCVKGEIFDFEIREIKGGKNLLIFSMTDYTSSINCKLFLRDNNKEKIINNIKKGVFVKTRGDVIFDTYSKEMIINISDIEIDIKDEKMDKEIEKRVELHAHTQMSAMDAVVSASKLIERAAKWGHKAIAITDHGVVQAFPEAMSASKKYGIKVIYGVEGYIVNDTTPVIKKPNSLPLDQTFVVFDIETTGLSNQNDKITEIGAVKIRNFQIVDTFSALINPEIPIPKTVQELTGITDEMVTDKEKIHEILPKFIDFVGDSVLVAHNAEFDIGFIRENTKSLGIDFNNNYIDTISLAKVLLPNLKKYKLNIVAKELNIKLENHHRAVDDAQATAHIFVKFLEMLSEKGVKTLYEVNNVFRVDDYKKLKTNHITILAKNYIGLKNLYKIVSQSHINYFYKNPRIPKTLLSKYREGLLIGSACEAGEVYQAVLNNVSEENLEEIVKFYDYLEIMPVDNNKFMLEKGVVKSIDELKVINRKIVDIGKKYNKIVVATGDVHFLDEHDEIFRKILKHSQGFSDANTSVPLYFKSTDEMLKEFEYLGESLAREVVITNTNKIADLIENIKPIPDETYPPIIEGSEDELRNSCYEKAHRIYGDPLPDIVKNRLDRELNSIINNGYAVMYIIAQKLVKKSLEDGYLVGSRGSVGSSFAATMSDITEVNPLPPHYICSSCKYSYFYTDGSVGSGADLPDKKCPKCDTLLTKDGHDIPFEVFLGFEGDKEPDIDLNFAGEYQSTAHKYTEELFGEGYVFRAGTIGTIAEKTAYGFVKKYLEECNISATSAEINRLSNGCTGIKRTSGQHPGGVMIVPRHKDIHDFTPIQYPANDSSAGVITTHFDYHSISGRILKLDILGHDVPTIIKMLEDLTGVDATKIPLDDRKTMSIFTSTKALGISPNDINSEIGSLGIPEFGTKFVRQMLMDTKPSTFAELVRISGLSHGTDVWLNNAQDLVRNGVAELKDVISTRDDIMNYLIYKGLAPKEAFKIMENVRKGKGLTQEHEKMMKQNNVPQWYIDSCNKIKYMFPKAHAVAYVMMSFRIAYFKVHYPLAFYATYFTTKAEDFDADLVTRGKKSVEEKIKEIEKMGNNITAKEKNLLTVLEVVLEMFARKIEVLKVDLYKSDAKKFKIVDGKLLPPLIALQGVGENAAINIARERESEEFLSIEDLRIRTKISKTVIETLKNHGCLDGMPETNQISLL